MPIKSRFVPGGDATAEYYYPQPLKKLFDAVPPMGSILERRVLFTKCLPECEKLVVELDQRLVSIRPAWSRYYSAPATHVIVTGHILFYHNDHQTWQHNGHYYQPSTRLFTEDPKIRMKKFQELVERVTHRPERIKDQRVGYVVHSF